MSIPNIPHALSVSLSNMTSSNGNIGIGTTTPSYALDVKGIVNATSFIGTTPYFVWHFNWNSAPALNTIIGATGIINSSINTTFTGTYINTPGSGRFTAPITGVYLCTFDCCAQVGNTNCALLRINGTYYNPYATFVGSYQQQTIPETVFCNIGDVVDWYVYLGSFQGTAMLQAGQGSGKGITFSLL